MSSEPIKPRPKLKEAFAEWAKEHLPWGLKAFVPWFCAEVRAVRQGWAIFIFISLLVAGVASWAMYTFGMNPVSEKLKKEEHRAEVAELKLAPFLAAGNQYFSSVPSAVRLDFLLATITNSASDLAELRRLQSRKAKIEVLVTPENTKWSQRTETIQPLSIVYVPISGTETNIPIGFHFVLSNAGDLPAEIVHVYFNCATQQVCVAPQWTSQNEISVEEGEWQYQTKIDALYSGMTFAMGAIRLTPNPNWRRVSTPAKLTIFAKNAEPLGLPFEFFFFKSRTNMPVFISTNREIWRLYEAGLNP